VLLALTGLIGAQTVARGSAIVLQGVIHLMIFASFLFIALSP
jgi:Ca2+:H+ antiporter